MDIATLLASRERFARVCIEVDLQKPLMAGYWIRGEFWRLQYEELHDLCFGCGCHGHRDATCPLKMDARSNKNTDANRQNAASPHGGMDPQSKGDAQNKDQVTSNYGEWMVLQRNR